MTEAEWLCCTNPDAMLYFLQVSVTLRKYRLFAVACCRSIWSLMTDERSRRLVEVVERLADGRTSSDDWKDASSGARQAWEDTSALSVPWLYGLPDQERTPEQTIGVSVLHSTTSAADALGYGSVRAQPGAEGRAVAHSVAMEAARAVNEDYPNSPERPRQCAILRDIVGNPFRPIALADACRTPTIVFLACASYDERQLPSAELDPDRLSVLADALEEVGAPRELVAHLRGPGPHVRGCHVLDLCLRACPKR